MTAKLSITLLIMVISFQSSRAQSLKHTVNKFTQVMAKTQTTSSAFIKKLKPLLDPDSNVDSLSIDYYQHWKNNAENNSYPISTKIEKLEIVIPMVSSAFASATVLL